MAFCTYSISNKGGFMRLLLALTILVMIIATPLLNGCAGTESVEGNTLGYTAINFQLYSLDGDEVKLSDLRGQPVMLNFWATWCGPCRVEMPLFQEIYEDTRWSQKGLVILAVDVQETAGDIQQFMEANGFSFTVLLDTTGEITNKYNLRGIPTTFFIDKDGIIKDVNIGAFMSEVQIEQSLNLIME
jgi:cytochrome c biogenesis protein CcmG/thiol:disulfide interchange protein DsbE